MLELDEPPAFRIVNAAGASDFLLTADHAGRRLPRRLGDLGLTARELERHIAWDIGIAEVTLGLAEALDAPAILQTYSRLVIDCNRPPGVASSIPELSEATRIPGNAGLTESEKLARRRAIFDPYHAAIGRLIAGRGARRPIYLAMHSFTPEYLGAARPMHAAVLYNRNPRASLLMANMLRAETGLIVTENAPYRVSDETDYGVPVHAERGGLDYLELEIRQDLIKDRAGQAEWVARLARLLPILAEQLGRSPVEIWPG